MKVLTKNTDYAIRALLALEAQKGSYVSAKSIATGHDIPYQFLRRLLQEMIRHRRLRDVPENVKLSGQAFILFKDALVSFLFQVLYNIHYVIYYNVIYYKFLSVIKLPELTFFLLYFVMGLDRDRAVLRENFCADN